MKKSLLLLGLILLSSIIIAEEFTPIPRIILEKKSVEKKIDDIFKLREEERLKKLAEEKKIEEENKKRKSSSKSNLIIKGSMNNFSTLKDTDGKIDKGINNDVMLKLQYLRMGEAKLSLGFGIDFKRELQDSSGQWESLDQKSYSEGMGFSVLPVYALFRYQLPEFKNTKSHLNLEFGYPYVLVLSEARNGDLFDPILYYGIGLGMELGKFEISMDFTDSYLEHKKELRTFRSSSINVSLGYRFKGFIYNKKTKKEKKEKKTKKKKKSSKEGR